MAETTKTKVYQEGNYGCKVFKYNESADTYGTGVAVKGLVNVNITFTRTVTNTPADDIVDYLTRRSPEKGEGTITFLGLALKDYKALYNEIVDTNNVVVLGQKNMSQKLGIIFYNTENSAEGTSENMVVLPSCQLEMPNLATTTIAEDDTTVRPFELAITCNAKNFTKKTGTTTTAPDRYTMAIVNSVDNADIYATVKDTVYVPDTTITP